MRLTCSDGRPPVGTSISPLLSTGRPLLLSPRRPPCPRPTRCLQVDRSPYMRRRLSTARTASTIAQAAKYCSPINLPFTILFEENESWSTSRLNCSAAHRSPISPEQRAFRCHFCYSE